MKGILGARRVWAGGLVVVFVGCMGPGKDITIDWPVHMSFTSAMRATGLCASSDGKWLGIASEDHGVGVVDDSSDQPQWVLRQPLPTSLFQETTCIRFATDDRALLIYNPKYLTSVPVKGGEHRTISTSFRWYDLVRTAGAVSPTGILRAVGMEHGEIGLIDVASDKSVREMKGHFDVANMAVDLGLEIAMNVNVRGSSCQVTALAFSPDGQLLASGDHLGAVRTWDVATGRMHCDLVAKNLVLMNRVLWLEFSRDKQYLAVGTVGDVFEKITIYHLATRRKHMEIPGATLSDLFVWEPSTSLPADNLTEFTADGRYFLCPRKNDVEIWDVKERQRAGTLAGHTGWVDTLCVDPKGQWAVTGSHDGTVRFWDLGSRQCVGLLVMLPEGEYYYIDYPSMKVSESAGARKYYASAGRTPKRKPWWDWFGMY